MDDRNMFARKNIIDLILIYWGAMTGVYCFICKSKYSFEMAPNI